MSRYRTPLLVVVLTFLLGGVRAHGSTQEWHTFKEESVSLGVTGIVARLDDGSKVLVVETIKEGSRAQKKVRVADVITGVNGKSFTQAHDYASLLLDGPLGDFAQAIEDAEGSDGQLKLELKRDGKDRPVTIDLEPIGRYGENFPQACAKSRRIHKDLLEFLSTSGKDTGIDVSNMMATLALMASGDRKHRALVQARMRKAAQPPHGNQDRHWIWNLSYRLIALAEYVRFTNDRDVLRGMAAWCMVLESAQIKADRPHTHNKRDVVYKKGAFGHFVVVDGYGDMTYTTALAMTALRMCQKCGIKVDQRVLDLAFDYMERSTTAQGKVGYSLAHRGGGGPGLGRAGVSMLGHALSPRRSFSKAALEKGCTYIRKARKQFLDGHADSYMTISWSIVGMNAFGDTEDRKVFNDYLRPWLNLSRQADGSFVSPVRYHDNDFGRGEISGAMALFLGMPDRKLWTQGKTDPYAPGLDVEGLDRDQSRVYDSLCRGNYTMALRGLRRMLADETDVTAGLLKQCLDQIVDREIQQSEALRDTGDLYLFDKRIKENKSFQGIPAYEQAVKEWEALLTTPESKALLSVGRKYHLLREKMAERPSPRLITQLKSLAEANQDNYYGRLAAGVLKR